MQSGRSKILRLQEWADQEEDILRDKVLFSTMNQKWSKGQVTKPKLLHAEFLPENQEILRLSPERAGLSSPAFTISNSLKLARSGALSRLAESEEEEFLFAEDIGPETFTKEILNKLFERQKFLPGSFVSLSPTRRKSHSDYENSDTDITEINDEEFEGIDDIFGKEESGILSSNLNSYTVPNVSRASVTLSNRKQVLQRAAEVEDREMRKRYQKRYGEGMKTAAAKDQLGFANGISKKPSIHFISQYNEFDEEPLEKGFFNFAPEMLSSQKLSLYRSSSNNTPHLGRQASLPSLGRSFKTTKSTGPKKVKSTMELAKVLDDERESKLDDLPMFNNYNSLIKKLERMPSFQFSNKDSTKIDTMPPLSSSEGQERENRLLDMEKRKAELLEKYCELTEKQAELRMSPSKVKSQLKSTKRQSKKNVGLLKNLNHNVRDPMGYALSSRDMKYNPDRITWEGNDHDLLRFEDDVRESIRARKPSLITSKDFGYRKESRNGNMIYDAENLRWINLDKADEEDEGNLDKLPDLVPNDIPQYIVPRSRSRRALGDRGVSQFTQRTVLAVSSGSSAKSVQVGSEFAISRKLLAKFEKEEEKIYRKTHQWFGPNERYSLRHPPAFGSDYFWEIRKMVINTRGK